MLVGTASAVSSLTGVNVSFPFSTLASPCDFVLKCIGGRINVSASPRCSGVHVFRWSACHLSNRLYPHVYHYGHSGLVHDSDHQCERNRFDWRPIRETCRIACFAKSRGQLQGFLSDHDQ